jgi:hypothetical protein
MRLTATAVPQIREDEKMPAKKAQYPTSLNVKNKICNKK